MLRNTNKRHLRSSIRRSCQWSTYQSKASWLFLQLLKCRHTFNHSLLTKLFTPNVANSWFRITMSELTAYTSTLCWRSGTTSLNHQTGIPTDNQGFSRKSQYISPKKRTCIFMVRNRVLDACNAKDTDASFIVLKITHDEFLRRISVLLGYRSI